MPNQGRESNDYRRSGDGQRSFDDRRSRDETRSRDEERAYRDDLHDRNYDEWRSQGQSGFYAGRQSDRWMDPNQRYQAWPRNAPYADRDDERFTGRGSRGDEHRYGDRDRERERERAGRDTESRMYGRGYGYDDGDRQIAGYPYGQHYTGYGQPGYPRGDRQFTGYGQPGRTYHVGQRGKGPMGYQRTDERIRELVCEALSDDDQIDASTIEVAVKTGEVILTGMVEERRIKRMIEDVVERVAGVRDVQNQIRVGGFDRRVVASTLSSKTPDPRDARTPDGRTP